MTAWYLSWLWQGMALALVTAMVARMAPKLDAAMRYWSWWGALGGLVWLGAHAWWAEWGTHSGDAALASGGVEASRAAPFIVVPAAPDVWVAIAFGIWAGVAVVRLVRVLAAVEGIWGLRARCRSIPDEVEARLPLWGAARQQGRSSRLMLCDEISGPTLLGFGRPYVALPQAMLTTLTTDELDAVVLHEHAHAQRRDDWMTLLQALLQALFWIHPAAAVIGRALNFERELACDERVVARTASPKDYARCLTRAAEVRSARHQTALGSALFGAAGQLSRRVDRLLAMGGGSRPRVSRLAAIGGVCAIGVAAVQLRTLPAVAEIGEVVVPAVAIASGLAVGEGAAPVQTGAMPAEPQNLERQLPPRQPVSMPMRAASSMALAEPIEGSMADIAHSAYDESAPVGEEGLLTARASEPAPPNETAQRGPFWRRFERAGVGIGGAFANFGQSVARRF